MGSKGLGIARNFVTLGVGECDLHRVAIPCQQRYRWCLEKNATQMAAISWRLTSAAFAVLVRVINHLDPDICRQ